MVLTWRPRSALARYTMATVAVLIAFLVRVAMSNVLGESSPRLLMTLAILLSAWWGGLWAGIYATVLGAVLGNLLVAPAGRFAIEDPKQIVLVGLFLFIGTAISILTNSMQSAQRRAEASAAAARRNWESLLESDQRAHSMAQRAVEWRNRFDALVEPAKQTVCLWDPRQRELRFNEGIEALVGYTSEELGRSVDPWIRIIHPDDRASVEAQIKRLDQQRETEATEYRVRHRNGDFLTLEVRHFPILNAAGEVDRIVGVMTDVSLRKRVAESPDTVHSTA